MRWIHFSVILLFSLAACFIFNSILYTANATQSNQRLLVTTPPATGTTLAQIGGIRRSSGSQNASDKQYKSGMSYGDPHIITFDGFRYSFQTIGEFILAKSTDGKFEVQVRQAQVPGEDLSLNTAVAMKLGNDRVAFYSQVFPDTETTNPLRVNGKPAVIENGVLTLPSGGKIYQENERNYLVEWSTGERVTVKTIQLRGSDYMNVKPEALESSTKQFAGLLGNLNNDPADDMRTRSGKVIPSRSTYGEIKQASSRILPIPGALPLNRVENLVFDQFYKEFGDSWRIKQEESLFDYASGQNTATFTNRSFPKSYKTLDMLVPKQLQQAQAACAKAKVEPDLLQGCIFDVGFTGDNSFAKAAADAVVDIARERIERAAEGVIDKIPRPRIPGLPF